MVGAMTVANIIGNIAKGLNDGNSIVDSIQDPAKRSLLMTNGDIVSLVSSMILEPRFVVSSSLKGSKPLEKVLEKNMAVFAGIHAKAFTYLMEVTGLNISSTMSLLQSAKKKDLRNLHDMVTLSFINDSIDLTDLSTFTVEKKKEREVEDKKETKNEFSHRKGFNNSGKIEEGLIKTSTLSFSPKGQSGKVEISVFIRPTIKFVSNADITLLMGGKGTYATSYASRMDDYRGGAIPLWKVFLPLDLLKSHKKNLIRDSSEVLKDLRDMEEDAQSKILTDGAVGFGKNYRFMIIDASMKTMAERALGNKFSNGASNVFLNSVNAMGVDIMDDNFGVNTSYLSGLDGKLDTDYKDLSGGGKTDSTSDILAYLAGMR